MTKPFPAMKYGTVYLHVGLQKTASTFFQKKLFPYIPGVSYVGRPYTQENHAFNALQYADDALYDPAAVAAELTLLRKHAGEVPILISDELLSGFPFYGLVNRGMIARRLAEHVPDAEILLFIRGQIDLIQALYNQYVKIGWFSNNLDRSFLHDPGAGLSYDDWVHGERKWSFKNRLFNHRSVLSTRHFIYSKLISMYESRFARVHVFLFEDLKHDSEDVIRRLERILSAPIPRSNLRSAAPLNASVKERKLQTRLMRNRLTSAFPERGGPLISRLVAGAALFFHATQSEEERSRFVRESLHRGGIFEDNRRLNADRGLGMEKYAAHYFGETTPPAQPTRGV